MLSFVRARVNQVRRVLEHPSNRGHRLRSLGQLAAWSVSKRIVRGPTSVLLPTGLKLECWANSYGAGEVMSFSGWPDFHEMTFFWRYLRPGDAFLDVGANMGLYTLLAASRVGQSGSVDAFEAGPPALERLRSNLSANQLTQVRVHPVAVADKPGTVSFLVGRDSKNRVRQTHDAAASTVDVPSVRLDDALSPELRFAAGKMDIEGFEPVALQGALEHLRHANPPVWSMELCAHVRGFGHTQAGFATWLREQGYDLGLYDAEHNRLEFPEQPWTLRTNTLVVARSQRGEVERRLAERARELPPLSGWLFA